MAMNRPRTFLICYDIADIKRLARLHRVISRKALMVQQSVYLAYLRPHEMSPIRKNIQSVIREREDDVRIYTLPDHAEWVSLCRAPMDLLPAPTMAVRSLMQDVGR